MKRIHLIGMLTCLSICCVFTACKKDKDKLGGSNSISTITATSIVNSADAADVAIVKLMSGNYEVVAGEYSGSGFMLTLPATVPATELERLGTASGLKVSDPDVGVMMIESVTCFDETKYEIGDFLSMKEEEKSKDVTMAMYWYVDGDVTVMGKVELTNETDNYNLNLKKGWNMLYLTEQSANNYMVTTTPKSGMQWVFFDISMRSAKSAKLTEKMKRLSLFK